MPGPVSCERKLTHVDATRLERLHAASPHAVLSEVLDEAEVVPSPEIPPDVVTMYTQFQIEEVATHRRQTLVLCYPADAEPSAGYISVLSPAGLGLLGTRVGDTARWRTPDGEENAAEVLAILFQPEATGDYVT